MAWEKLANVSWCSGGTIDTCTFTAKEKLLVHSWFKIDCTGGGFPTLRFNNDSCTNYADRYECNNSEFTTTNQSRIIIGGGFSGTCSVTYYTTSIKNIATEAKLTNGHSFSSNSQGEANIPGRRTESSGKWDNTTCQINSIQLVRSSGNFQAGEIVVWGTD